MQHQGVLSRQRSLCVRSSITQLPNCPFTKSRRTLVILSDTERRKAQGKVEGPRHRVLCHAASGSSLVTMLCSDFQLPNYQITHLRKSGPRHRVLCHAASGSSLETLGHRCSIFNYPTTKLPIYQISQNPVILSGTERRRREVKSKDPDIASFAMPHQGVLS